MVSELIEFSTVVGEIYDAAIDPTLWQQALGSICAYVGGASAVLYWHDTETERSEALHLFNEIPQYTKSYFEKYLPLNPMFPAAAFVEIGIVSSSSDIMPYEEFVETRFFKEWVKPQGIVDALAVNFEKGTARASLINVRTEMPVTEKMRSRMAALVPHLRRAVAIGGLFDQSKAAVGALTESLDYVKAAVFLVGRQGEIVFANSLARAMLRKGDMLREQDNKLHAVVPATDRLLRDSLGSSDKDNASFGDGGIALPLKDASQDRWFAHVLALTAGNRRWKLAGRAQAAVAAVFIRRTTPNAPPPLESIAKIYKLTAGEIRVLDAVLKVSGLKAIAEILGVSQATVKTHLNNVYRKTGTARQSDLVKMVAGI